MNRPTPRQQDNLPNRRWLPPIFFLAIGFDYRLSAGAGPTLAVLEAVAFLAIFIWFCDLVWSQRRVMATTMNVVREWRWVVFYFLWAWITVWVGFSRSADNLFAFRNLFPALVIGVVTLVFVRNEGDVKRCFIAYLFGVLVNVALAVPQKIFGRLYPNSLHEGALVKMDLAGEFVTNTPAGFFVHPNGLAVYLIPAIIFLFFGAFTGYFRGWKARFLAGAFAICVAAVMWLTYAKGAIFWAMVGLCIAFAPRSLRRYPGWLALGALSVIPAILFVSTDPFHLGFKTLSSMITRFEIWGSAIAAFRDDPYILLFGNGFRTIYYKTLRLSELPYLNAHNNVLNQILFFGVPALLLYFIAMSAAFRRAGERIRSSGDLRILTTLVGVTVALVGAHFFEPVLDSVALQAQYYGFLALTLAACRVPTENGLIRR